MIRLKIIAAASIALLVSSCGLYKKYESQEVNNTELAGVNLTLPDSAVVAVPTWEHFFTDAKLQNLISRVLTDNSDLEIARLNIEQTERALTTARLAYLPSLMLSADGSTSKFGSSGAVPTYSIPLTASWEIDVFGKNYNKKEQAKVIVEQSREYVELVKTQLIAAVASNYYALVLTDNQINITQESLKNLKDILAATIELKKAGMQNEAAVAQLSANVKEVEISLQTLQENLTLTQNNLCLLLNQPPQSIDRLFTIEIDGKEELTNSISLAALSNRPDVRYAEMMLAQSFYEVSHARSSMYPSITLNGSAGWTNNAGMIVNPGDILLSALGSLTQPLFMANRNRANLENAKDKYEQQLTSFEKSLLQAGKEVNDALTTIQYAESKRDLSESQVVDLERAVSVTQELMVSGKANYLEVLTAQNTYLAAKLNNVSINYSIALGQISLYKALGGGSER